MARIHIPAEAVLTPYAQYGRDLFWAAADPVNGNAVEWYAGGPLLLLLHNTGADAAHTVVSTTDPYNRTGDLVANVPAGAHMIFGPFEPIGWRQVDRTLHITAGSADVQVAALYSGMANRAAESVRHDIITSYHTVLTWADLSPVMWHTE